MAQRIDSPFERERLAVECKARLNLLNDGDLDQFAEFLYAWLAHQSRHVARVSGEQTDLLFGHAGPAGESIAKA